MPVTTINPVEQSAREKADGQVICPKCNSTALYKYGKTSAGNKRYLCLVCNRQFTKDSFRKEIKGRPSCPACGKKMHVYMRGNRFIRFRCSGYPGCKTFIKISMENEK
jgi:transposase-like protein